MEGGEGDWEIKRETWRQEESIKHYLLSAQSNMERLLAEVVTQEEEYNLRNITKMYEFSNF